MKLLHSHLKNVNIIADRKARHFAVDSGCTIIRMVLAWQSIVRKAGGWRVACADLEGCTCPCSSCEQGLLCVSWACSGSGGGGGGGGGRGSTVESNSSTAVVSSEASAKVPEVWAALLCEVS